MGDLMREQKVNREQILNFQNELAKFEQVDFPLRHYHANGIYAREIQTPAGAIVVGKIQKYSHVNTISKGRCIVITENGRMEIVAPFTFVSEAGAKRCVCVLEDVIWTTYHATEKEILEDIEEELIAPDFESFDRFQLEKEAELLCHG